MKSNTIAKYILYAVIFATGIFIGRTFYSGSPSAIEHAEDIEWTCSMHPQIRMPDNKNMCPLCAMDLIPVRIGSGGSDPDAVQMSEEAIALASIQTIIVNRSIPEKEIRLFGTINLNERLIRSQVSHVSGRIERLLVNTVGEAVSEGQTVATIYSPDLLNAQQELIQAKRLADVQPALHEAAREKLRLWRLSDEQIADIERSETVSPSVAIKANANGIVTARRIEQGDYVSQGSVLLDLADLSSVWAVFDAYEADLPFLKKGDTVKYTLQALPGRIFSDKISFIEPMLDRTTRTVKVRVETDNPHGELKPEMFANGEIKAVLHNSADTEIIVPKTAVLWTGRRSVVYVKLPDTEEPTFKLREIELGPSLGDAFVVLSGISEGEEIVARGAFVVDASAQLEGRLNMMHMEAIPTFHEDALLRVEAACGMCTTRIEDAAKAVPGVSSASYNLRARQLRVYFDASKTSLDVIGKAVADAGHDNALYRADDHVYAALHSCCLYRN